MQSVEINQDALGGIGFYLAMGPWAYFPTLIEVVKGENGLEVHGKDWKISLEKFPGLHKGWKYSSPIAVDFKRPAPVLAIKPQVLVKEPVKEVTTKKKPYILFRELQKAGKIKI